MERRNLAAALSLGVAAAAATSQPAAAQAPGRSRLAQILERGTIRIGTTGWCWYDLPHGVPSVFTKMRALPALPAVGPGK